MGTKDLGLVDENTLSKLAATRLGLLISKSLLDKGFRRCYQDQLRLEFKYTINLTI